jgi:DNA repair protein RadC
MARPEQARRYQLAFDFAQKPLEPAEFYQEGRYRFIRPLQERVIVRSPTQAAQHFMQRIFTPFARCDQEELWALLLNSKNRITHEALIYRGNLNQIHTRLAEIFKPAIYYNAAGFIIAHNHPSGDPTPSPEDLHMSEEVLTLANKLGIELLDHIVVGDESFFSMREHGVGVTGPANTANPTGE